MDLFEANISNASKILKENWSDFTIPQKIQIALVEKELTSVANIIIEDLSFQQKLTEKELTADQIDAIFADTVKAMGDRAAGSLERSGVNKAVGKTIKLGGKALTLSKDAVVAVDKKVNELGKLVQQTEPVKNLDATVSKLQADIRKKLEQGPVGKDVMSMVDKYAQFAKDNPVKSSLIIGALTSVAAIAGGPLGGAAAGYLLRTTNGLLQGEKFSTASGKAIKTAAYGALAGVAFEALTDNILDNVMISGEEEFEAMKDAYIADNIQSATDDIMAKFGIDETALGELDGARILNSTGNYNGFFWNYDDILVMPDQVAELNQLQQAIANTTTFSEENVRATVQYHEYIRANILGNPENIKAKEVVDALAAIPKGDESINSLQEFMLSMKEWETQDLYTEIENAGAVAAAAAQGATQTAADIMDPNKAQRAEPVDDEKLKAVKDQNEKEQQGNNESIDRIRQLAGVQQLDEFDLKGALKKVAGGVTSTVKKGADAVNKVAQNVGATTPEKLKKAWNDAGAPSDDAGLYNFLVNTFGVPVDAVKTAYDNRAIDINTFNKSADKGQEEKPEEPKKPTPNLTGKYATQGVEGDKIKTGADAQKQTGGQQGTGTIDIQTVAKQIMALSAKDKTKIIQALTPKPAESVETDNLVLENMEDKTTYSLNISKHKDGTSMNSSITSDKPDELARILALAGMADKMSKPEMHMEPEMEPEMEPSPCGMGEEEVEENRMSKEKYYDTDYMVNDLAGGINRPKRMYKRASPGDNPMAVSEAERLREEYSRYKASKNK